MQHVETTISSTSIRIRFANDTDATKATEWIDLRIKQADLKHPSGTRISQPEIQYLGELQTAALSHALQIIQAEIRRLKNAGDAIG